MQHWQQGAAYNCYLQVVVVDPNRSKVVQYFSAKAAGITFNYYQQNQKRNITRKDLRVCKVPTVKSRVYLLLCNTQLQFILL